MAIRINSVPRIGVVLIRFAGTGAVDRNGPSAGEVLRPAFLRAMTLLAPRYRDHQLCAGGKLFGARGKSVISDDKWFSCWGELLCNHDTAFPIADYWLSPAHQFSFPPGKLN